MDLTRQIKGKEVAEVITNGHLLIIRMKDGSEFQIKWVDDNGDTIKGLPVVGTRGFRLRAEGMRDLMYLPSPH